MNRRKFLQHLGLFGGGLILPLGVNSWISYNLASNTPQKSLVVILLRGGIDGLSVLVPYGDDNYYAQRATIAINPPDDDKGVFNLDGYFGLHPSLKDLMPLWQNKTLAFVTCCGLINNNRSHFEAQHLMETGTDNGKKSQDGWLNRLLGTLNKTNPIQGVNLGSNTPQILKGSTPVANLPRGNIQNQQSFLMDSEEMNNLFAQLYQGNDPVSVAYQQGNEARKLLLQELQKEMMMADNGAPSADNFAQEAKKIATLMKGNANTQVAFIDFGKWDTHTRQTPTLNSLLPAVGKGLSLLVEELGDRYKDTTIVVMSEFGRTLKENGNGGTDHGHGNIMWLLGGKVKGGNIYGQWDGLANNALHEGRDLPVTTDYRLPLATIMTKHLRLSSSDVMTVFPSFSPSSEMTFI